MDLFGSPTTDKTPPVKAKKPPTTVTKGLIPFVKAPVKPKGFQMPPPPAWVSGTKYNKKALVLLEGQVYRSKRQDNVSTPSTSSEDWTLVRSF